MYPGTGLREKGTGGPERTGHETATTTRDARETGRADAHETAHPALPLDRAARGVCDGDRLYNRNCYGGVTVSTGTVTPRDAGRACSPARKSGGKSQLPTTTW